MRMDDEVTAAVAANNWVAERAAEADEATPRRFFADLGKRLEPLLDKVRCYRAFGFHALFHNREACIPELMRRRFLASSAGALKHCLEGALAGIKQGF